MIRRLGVALITLLAAHDGLAQQPPAKLGSTPTTVARGHIPTTATPVLRVKPGQNVTIDALSHAGVNSPSPLSVEARPP